MCGCVDDTPKPSIFNCPKLSILNKLAGLQTGNIFQLPTIPSCPSPVCESRHQPPSKLGIRGGGMGKEGVVETCGNIGRADSKTEDEKSHFNQQL